MSEFPNPFDTCGLAKVRNDASVTALINNFEIQYRENDFREDLSPYQIYLSKNFLQKILREMRKKPNQDKSKNCVRLRLGLQHSVTNIVPLSWMLQTLHATQLEDGEQVFEDEGGWYVSDFPTNNTLFTPGSSNEGKSTEPVVMKDPQGEQ